jgi:phosphoribosylaminoimidazole (AIR) synthetase
MGNFSQETLDTTLNQVLGMVLDLPKHQLEEVQVYFQYRGIEAWRVGQVIAGEGTSLPVS